MISQTLRPIARGLFRSANQVLGRIGFELTRAELDFDSRPLDQASIQMLFNSLCADYESWLVEQTIIAQPVSFDVTAAVETFFGLWIARPFRRRTGGSRFNNLLWLYLIAKTYKPDIVIDSGTFEGASAWAFRVGAPEAQIYSFDIDLSQMQFQCTDVKYVEKDWMDCDLQWQPQARVLAYFDDHVDQARRLIEAADRACSLLIFDDDYPITSFYQMAPTPEVLPKIEFVLDERLVDGQLLEWAIKGRRQSWQVDKSYLVRARERIRATTRLPFTGLSTGIMQTPYRLIIPR